VFAVASFIETVGFGHFLSFQPLLVRSLGVPESDVAITVGLLSAAALLVGLPLVPFWGAWADRYSRKLIVVRSAVVEAVLFFLLALVREPWQLFVLVPLIGLVLGNTGVMLAELTDRTPRARLAFSISVVGAAGPLGFAVGPAIGGVIADQQGLPVLFLADAVLTAAVVLLLLVGYHERPDRLRTTERVMTLVSRSLIAVVRSPLARVVFVTYFLLLLGQRFLLPYLALYVEQLHGSEQLATVVGLVAGGYGLAAAIGSPAAGVLADRVGYGPVLRLGIVVAAICLGIAAVAPDLLSFAIVYAIYGIGFATAASMLFTLLASGLPADIRSPVLNLALLPLYLSGVIGALLSTAIIAAFGGRLQPIWLISAVVIAAGLIPVSRLARRAGDPQAGEAG
jgi:DHA1 family multidrug resistance protein-like MFS transporter